MRFSALLIAFALSATPAQAQQQQALSARAAYVERSALLEADRRCTLFTEPMRIALTGGAAQARGALLRGGWTSANVAELESAAIGAARARRCGDQRTEAAAARARLGFQSWSRTHAMTFTGGERSWSARRTPDPVGAWRLKQDMGGGALFGVREDREGRQELALALPAGSAPAMAQLLVRDPARAAQSQVETPGRLTRGLAAGAPTPFISRNFVARARRMEDGRVVFLFPDAALNAMGVLDPRESAVVLLGGRTEQRLYIEIGDLAAARAFLAV